MSAALASAIAGGGQMLGIIYGSGGVGKSHFSKQVMAMAGEKLSPDNIRRRSEMVMAASASGIAANVLSGSTLHSMFSLSYTRKQKKAASTHTGETGEDQRARRPGRQQGT
jgi:hypothetical protein